MERLEDRRLAASILFTTDYMVGGVLQDEPAGRLAELQSGDVLTVIVKGQADEHGILTYNVRLLYDSHVFSFLEARPFDGYTNHTYDLEGNLNPHAVDAALDEFGRELTLTGADVDLEPDGTHPVSLIAVDLAATNDLDVPLMGLFGLVPNADALPIHNLLNDGDTYPQATPEISDDSYMVFDILPGAQPEPPDLHNELLPADADGDGQVTRGDALLVLEDKVAYGLRSIDSAVAAGNVPEAQVDVNNDGQIGQLEDLMLTVGWLSKRMLLASFVGS